MFLADEDLAAAIIQGLKQREPAIDILDAKQHGLRGTKGPALLELPVQQRRIIISHDRGTITRHWRVRLAEDKRSYSFGSASDADEWRDGIFYLPFR